MGSCSSKRIQKTHDSRAKLNLDEKIQYIKHTPFFLYLSQDNIEKFANCFPTVSHGVVKSTPRSSLFSFFNALDIFSVFVISMKYV